MVYVGLRTGALIHDTEPRLEAVGGSQDCSVIALIIPAIISAVRFHLPICSLSWRRAEAVRW
jgi:hypothetical protein